MRMDEGMDSPPFREAAPLRRPPSDLPQCGLDIWQIITQRHYSAYVILNLYELCLRHLLDFLTDVEYGTKTYEEAEAILRHRLTECLGHAFVKPPE